MNPSTEGSPRYKVHDSGATREREPWLFMKELTAQVRISNCKTWYENEFQVLYETWPQLRFCRPGHVPGFAVLFYGKLKNPNLRG